MKRLAFIVAICSIGMLAACELLTEKTIRSDQNNTENTENVSNPVEGTSWVWRDTSGSPIITWTFTFGKSEVVFDYLAEFSPIDITKDQYTATYTYDSNTVSFTMKVWSNIVWKYTGTISGNEMHLVDSGIEHIDIKLEKQ